MSQTGTISVKSTQKIKTESKSKSFSSNLASHGVAFFSGTSHPTLATEVAENLGIPLGNIDLQKFPDGEISVEILDNVRGKDVYVLQSVALQPNAYLMELLLIVDALKRASAKSITAVIPYYGYCRQDRRDKVRVPIAAKLVANLLEASGVSHVFCMDLHAGQIQGFFNIPVDNLYAGTVFVEKINNMDLGDLVIVSPDSGSIKLARDFSNQCGCGFAVVDKERKTSEIVSSGHVIGDVKDKTALILDDICSTGSTLIAAADACLDSGAKRVFAVITHALMTKNANEIIENSRIEKFYISNTIPEAAWGDCKKVKAFSVAKVFADAICCMQTSGSISSFF